MRIAALHTYPVKGCHRLDHDAARVEPWGLAGDRRWLVVDADGVGVTQRAAPELTGLRPLPEPGDGLTLRAPGRADLRVAAPVDGAPLHVRVFSSKPPVPARRADAGADAWLSALLGREVRLVWLADPTVRPVDGAPDERVSFADGYPFLLANETSLAWLNDRILEVGDEAVPMARFRPNIVVAGAPAWAEDGWLGRRLRLGDAVARVVKPCDRCVVTTLDQETGEAGRQPLPALGMHRRDMLGLLFGVYLIAEQDAGVVRVGDDVDLLP